MPGNYVSLAWRSLRGLLTDKVPIILMDQLLEVWSGQTSASSHPPARIILLKQGEARAPLERWGRGDGANKLPS